MFQKRSSSNSLHNYSSTNTNSYSINNNNNNNQQRTFTTAITDAERAEFREMFNFCKREGNSKDSRDRQELKYMMDILRLNPTESELDAMMVEVDTDGSGDVDFDEFVDVMSRTMPFSLPSAKLRASFRFFEDDQKEGFCSTELLREAILYHCRDEMQNQDGRGNSNQHHHQGSSSAQQQQQHQQQYPSSGNGRKIIHSRDDNDDDNLFSGGGGGGGGCGVSDDWDEAACLLSKLDPSRTGMIKIDDLMSVIVQSEKAVADLLAQQEKDNKDLAAAAAAMTMMGMNLGKK